MCRYLVVVSFFIVCFSNSNATVTVEGARFRPFQLAVYPFLSSPVQTQGQIVVDVLKNDLELSTVFQLLNPASFIAQASLEEASFQTTKKEDWVSIGAEGLVKLRIRPSKKGFLQIDVQMFFLGIGQKGLFKTYNVPFGNERRIAHQLANDVFLFFTGEEGFFLTSIVAVKQMGNRKQLVVMDIDGRNERQITSEKEGVVLPSFSPDGKSILYSTYMNHTSVLKELSMETLKSKRLSWYPGLNVGGIYDLINNGILLTLSREGDVDIYRMDRHGKKLKRLTQSIGIDTSPSVSSDGKHIAFVSSRSGSPHIYTMDADGTNVKRLTFQCNYNQSPEWNPAGQLIVFVCREGNTLDLYLMDLKTGQNIRLTKNQGQNEDPVFAPNGRAILFTSTRNGTRNLWTTNLDGSLQRPLTKTGSYYTPTWGKKYDRF